MKDFYETTRKNPNNFSHWYLVLQKAFSICNTELKLPDSLVFQLLDEVISAGFMDHPSEDREMMLKFVQEKVFPELHSIAGHEVFVKNGTFSDKFEGHYPNTFKSPEDITDAFLHINYQALCLDAFGFTEMVIRKKCPFNREKTPCIYSGLPFRPEFRVFYDFHKHQVLYSVNYWDWDYCHDAISRNATDRIIYEAIYPYIFSFYEANRKKVEEEIGRLLSHVKESDIGSRFWSVDVMYDDISTFWLIDMAVAEQSAYWISMEK